MRRAAQTLAEKLNDAEATIDAWRAIVEEAGPSKEALGALETLYAQESRWDDLGDAYQSHLDIADDQAERLSLLAKLGDLKRERLEDAAGALKAYRDAL